MVEILQNIKTYVNESISLGIRFICSVEFIEKLKEKYLEGSDLTVTEMYKVQKSVGDMFSFIFYFFTYIKVLIFKQIHRT